MSRILLFVLVVFATALFAKPVASFACPVSLDPAREEFRCVGGSQLTLRLPYFGVATGVSVTLAGPGITVVGGDNPAVVADGTIELSNLTPSATYVVTISGASCFGPDAVSYNFVTPNYFCGNDLTMLINEVIPEPGSDTNNDGVNNFLEEQFVEVFNPDPLVSVDLNGWNLIIGGTLRFTFPPGAVVGPRQAVTVFGGGFLTDPCHYAAAGFLSISSNGDIVSLTTPLPSIVHTMSFSGTSVPPNVSLALNPDGNVGGGFVPHTTIVSNPVNYSPCFSNHLPGVVLPVTLTSFTATYRKDRVLLDWSVAREENHAFFAVERSVDGRTWETIAMVEEAGPAYAAEDDAPPPSLIYYRLRQVDRDGTATLYGPRLVDVPDAAESLLLYPNPANQQLRIINPIPGQRFEIIDQRGRRWLWGKLPEAGSTAIDVAALPRGLYLFRALDGPATGKVIRWMKN